MAYDGARQQNSADARISQTQFVLILSSVPAAAPTSLIGKALLDAGSLTVPGVYACRIMTEGWSAVDVCLKPSAFSGTNFAPTLRALRWHLDAAHSTKTAAGANFIAGTEQTLSLTGLNGITKCEVVFTIPASTSINFDTATALAEFNGA